MIYLRSFWVRLLQSIGTNLTARAKMSAWKRAMPREAVAYFGNSTVIFMAA